MPIRVIIADDHPFVREGIRATLQGAADIVLVGEAINGDEAQRLCRDLQPDVLLLDLSMPGSPAFETVAALRTLCPAARVLVLTAYDDDVYVRGMLATGIAGYILKDEAPEVVVQAIRIVVQGGSWFSRSVLNKIPGRETAAPGVAEQALSKRELEVLRLVAANRTNQEIAAALDISEKTVEKHLQNVFRKWGVTTRLEAVLHAVRNGLIEP